MKIEAAQGEKIFVRYVRDQWTIIHSPEEIHKSIRKKRKISNRKVSKGYKKAIHRRKIVMDNNHYKAISFSGNQESEHGNNLPNWQKFK